MQYKVLKNQKNRSASVRERPKGFLCRGLVQCAVFPEEIIAILADWIRGRQPVH